MGGAELLSTVIVMLAVLAGVVLNARGFRNLDRSISAVGLAETSLSEMDKHIHEAGDLLRADMAKNHREMMQCFDKLEQHLIRIEQHLDQGPRRL